MDEDSSIISAMQAGFDILYIFGCADGELADAEIGIIREFIEENYKGEFDIESEITVLSDLSGDSILGRLDEASEFLKDDTSKKEKIAILDFILALIGSDGDFHPNEVELFSILGYSWDVDVEKYLKSRLG